MLLTLTLHPANLNQQTLVILSARWPLTAESGNYLTSLGSEKEFLSSVPLANKTFTITFHLN